MQGLGINQVATHDDGAGVHEWQHFAGKQAAHTQTDQSATWITYETTAKKALRQSLLQVSLFVSIVREPMLVVYRQVQV